MTGMWHIQLWLVLLFGWASPPSADDLPDPSKREHDEWLQRYNTLPKTSWFRPAGGGNQNLELPILLRVIALEEEGKLRTLSRGCEVATNGQVRSFAAGGSGTVTGYRAIPEADRQRLERLLTELPEGNGPLPPPGRRLILQVVVENRCRLHVYDRAHAPDLVWEVLRTSTCKVRPWVLDFKPESTVELGRSHGDGTLTLTPEGLFAYALDDHLVLFDPTRREELKRMPLRFHAAPPEIKFSPDGSLGALNQGVVNTRRWEAMDTFGALTFGPGAAQLTCPEFTADGRYLLYLGYTEETNGRRTEFLRAYDTKTWKKLDRIPGLPEDAVQCIESPHGKRAIVLAKGNRIALWDRDQNRPLARLDDDAQLHLAAFSPDESMVVVVTRHRESSTRWTAHRIRIWTADNGRFVRELLPFEHRTRFAYVRSVLWTKAGDYVIADDKIWNIASGRHRGTFSPRLFDLMGTVLPPGGRHLAMGGTTGGKTVIQFWDFAAALRELRALEVSFGKQSVCE